MAGPRIALVHALPESMTPIMDALARQWPAARAFNLLDDSLSKDLARRGRIDDAMTRRFVTLTRYAVDTGAAAVQFTCSAFDSCIEAARDAVEVPVLKPDEAMIEEALSHGPRLGIVVTFEPTIESSRRQIERIAAHLGVHPSTEYRHAAGALEAFRAGDAARHDALIAEAASQLTHCDVVMLAQYSMARAAPGIRAAGGVPVLTSPDAAVTKLRGLVEQGVAQR